MESYPYPVKEGQQYFKVAVLCGKPHTRNHLRPTSHTYNMHRIVVVVVVVIVVVVVLVGRTDYPGIS